LKANHQSLITNHGFFMPHRRTHRFRHTVAVLALLAGFVGSTAWILNRPEALRHALAIANVAGVWHFDIARLQWDPLASRVTLEGIAAEHRATARTLAAERLALHYNPLGLLRGKLVIDELALADVRIALPLLAKKPPPRRINLAKLILLKNLELTNMTVDKLAIAFGADRRLTASSVHLAMIPSIFGEARLDADAASLRVEQEDEPLATAGRAELAATTRLERWRDDFPYVNAFRGTARLAEIAARGFQVERAAAAVSLEGDLLSLGDFSLSIKGRELLGKLDADIEKQSYALSLEIPKPIKLPHFGADLETLSTSGELSGKITFEGRGLKAAALAGEGQLEITHRFDASPQAPFTVAANVTADHGVLRINGRGKAGSDPFDLSGTIDFAGKSMDLAAHGKRFPLDHVFDKFKNPHLARIFGPTDFDGTVKGWGKKFSVHVKATTYGGGWKPITADRVESELDVTYDLIALKGDVFEEEKKAGHADLAVRMGPKTAGRVRPKTVELTANVAGMPLAGPLGSFALAGTGTGSIVMKGPITAFNGVVTGNIERGSWHGIAFDHVATVMDLSRYKLLFHDMEVAVPAQPNTKLPGQLAGDISDAGLRLHGEPLPGLAIDASYRSAANRWQIAGISYRDAAIGGAELAASGSISGAGPLDLKVRGVLNAARLPLILSSVGEAEGALDVDLAVRGTSARPLLGGKVVAKDADLRLRNPKIALSSLSGTMRFEGSRLFFEDASAEVEDGTVKVSGWLEQVGLRPSSANLALSTTAMRYRSEDRTLSLELEGDLKLTGNFPQPLLAGDVTILDGRYTKDFMLLDMLTGAEKDRGKRKVPIEFNPRLALAIRNSGDMAIRNNVGDIWLDVNVNATGTREKPIVAGAITTATGQVHYLGVNFDITKGFVELRGNAEEPYLEVYAQKDIDVYSVNLVLHGRTDNLALDLSATSPVGALEKRDVISLILFGTTEQERQLAGRAGSAFGTSMVAQSLSGIVERPISKFTHLDVFRLEAAEAGTQGISRVSLGKQVSDRLTFTFATDISKTAATQSFATEYQITDNLLLKGSRSTDSTSEISGLLRFRLK
jgi:hypothetical protein